LVCLIRFSPPSRRRVRTLEKRNSVLYASPPPGLSDLPGGGELKFFRVVVFRLPLAGGLWPPAASLWLRLSNIYSSTCPPAGGVLVLSPERPACLRWPVAPPLFFAGIKGFRFSLSSAHPRHIRRLRAPGFGNVLTAPCPPGNGKEPGRLPPFRTLPSPRAGANRETVRDKKRRNGHSVKLAPAIRPTPAAAGTGFYRLRLS